jgi:hypothetical protein
LKARRIREIKFKQKLPENARLCIGEEGFRIELASEKKSFSWLRFTLAHEIAHSLFFDIEEWPPAPLISMIQGDRDLEWLCWQLARCLLVPQAWLKDHLSAFSSLSSPDFSLEVLFALERTFSVPWKVIAQRIVEDLGLWRVVLLQFVQLNDQPSPSEKGWYLRWHTFSVNETKTLFIPMSRLVDGITKSPQAKRTLLEFVSGCFERGKTEQFFRTTVPPIAFSTGTTGNLGKFLRGSLDSEEFPAFCAVFHDSQYQMFHEAHREFSSLLVCVPFTN